MMYYNKTDATNSEPNVCPNCGSKKIRYFNEHIAGEYYLYEFECYDCSSTGIEYNYLTFSGFEYNTPKDEEDVVKHEKIEDARRAIRLAEDTIEKAKKILAMYGEE